MKRKSSRGIDQVRKLQARSVGYLLIRCGQLWNDRGVARVNAQQQPGTPTFREAHTRLLPHLLEPGGIRLTELARRLSITKQAVQPLVADLVAARVVELVEDPDDARARRIVFTAFGLESMNRGTGELLRIEAELSRAFGAREMKALGKLLTRLLPVLEQDRQGP